MRQTIAVAALVVYFSALCVEAAGDDLLVIDLWPDKVVL